MYWSQIPDSGVPRVTEHESAGRARWVRSVEEEPDVDATLPEPGDPEFLEAVATVYKALVAAGNRARRDDRIQEQCESHDGALLGPVRPGRPDLSPQGDEGGQADMAGRQTS